MTGICAFIGSRSDVAKSKVNSMLDSMKVRGTESKIFKARIGKTSESTVGICQSSETSFQSPQKHPAVILDGAFFAENLPANLGRNSADEWLSAPGAFSFLGLDERGLYAGRDPLGQKPLYWGTDHWGNYAFASLRVALKRVGIAEPKPVIPGQLISMTDRGHTTSTDHVLTRLPHREISEGAALEELERLLLDSVCRMVPKDSALAFSGGLDSALIAVACKKAGINLRLVTVGLSGQPEPEHAVAAASSIGLQTHVEWLSRDDIVGALADVVRTVESVSPVTIGISLPFHFACRTAKELGASTIVAGQLSDELYGGYSRFERLALEGNLDRTEAAMWNSVLAASAGDFEPGDKVAVSFGLEIRCPFAYLPLVNRALQLPIDLKLRVVQHRVTRKYVLRRLAQMWGLPTSIADRPKKAVQYSTGVQKILEKEARRKQRTLGELLSSAA